MHKLKFKCILLLSEDTYDNRHFIDKGGCVMCTVEMANQINSNFMLTNLILSMFIPISSERACVLFVH